MRDYYEILDVPRDADEATIKRAYRRLALKYHPDRNKEAGAEEKFKEASEAYQVLSDASRRELYDRYGHEGLKSSGFSGFSGFDDIFQHYGDIFGDIFGFERGSRRNGGRRRGADLRYDLTLPFEDAVQGTVREIPITRFEPCVHCQGTGAAPGTRPQTCGTCGGRGQVVHSQGLFMISTTCPRCRGAGRVVAEPCRACEGRGKEQVQKIVKVRVPAGVDTGTRIRVPEEGEPGEAGGYPGDLYVFVAVEPHPAFERDGDDLHCEVTIDFVQATLGATVEVPTLDGSRRVDLDPGVQPGETIRLRNQGVPHLRGHGRGDLFLHVRVTIPTRVSKKQRQLLEQFAAL